MFEHNQPSFDAIVAENLRRGLVLTQRDVLINCIRDARLSDRHRLVLAAIIEHMNTETGMAYPGRAALAKSTTYLDRRDLQERHYTESGVGKTISELIEFKYLMVSRRAPEDGKRALSHYTIVRPDPEELRMEVQRYIAEIRARAKQPMPDISRAADVTPVGNVTDGGNVTPVGNESKSDVTPVGNVRGSDNTPVGNVTHGGNVRADVTPIVSADVTPVGRTVTSIGTSNNNYPPTPLLPEQPAPPAKRAVKAPRAAKVGTIIDPTWTPAMEQVDWVRARYVAKDSQIAEQAEKFRDYHCAKGTVSKDWGASWRTWWGNGYHRIPKRSAPELSSAVFAVDPDTDEGRQAYLDQLEAARSLDL